MTQQSQLFFRCRTTGIIEPALTGWAFTYQRTCPCGATIPSNQYWDHWEKETHTAPRGIKRHTDAWNNWVSSVK